jgi:hypothetical protein
VQGMERIPLAATLKFGKDFDRNGAIKSVEIAAPGVSR